MKKLIFILTILVLIAQTISAQQSSPVFISQGVINGIPIILVRPKYPKVAIAVRASGDVNVLVTINEKGNVIKAEPKSGHPLLWAESVKAAFQSKFKPILISDKPINVTGIIVYRYSAFDPLKHYIEEKPIPIPVVNGMATDLPKPIYPEKAKNTCAKGEVRIEVLIDENGNVIESNPISGDDLLWDSAVEAVKKAKFHRDFDAEPTRIKGIIVYNFPSEKNCLYTEKVVNEKAISFPKPIYPKSCRCVGKIRVRIVIDMDGNVILAEPFSGHPLLRISAVEAARKAKFSPTLINGQSFLIVAYLEYDFNSDGTIEY